MSTDPVLPHAGDPRYFGRYHYAANNPYKYFDPNGKEIAVAYRRVFRSFTHHALIVVRPDNQGKYANDPRFVNDNNGDRIMTVEGDLENGFLVNRTNLQLGRGPQAGEVQVDIPEGASEDLIIDRISDLSESYDNQVDYPEAAWLVGGGLNSNSYVNSLLFYSDLESPDLPVSVPSYENRIGFNHFDTSEAFSAFETQTEVGYDYGRAGPQ